MIKKIINRLYVNFSKPFVNKNLIIVRIDGGICSQLMQYAFGQIVYEKIKLQNSKAQIKYDLSWCSKDGWDLLHKDKRNFDLQKLFPSIKLQKASNKEISVYKRFYKTRVHDFNDLIKLDTPMCLDDYYDFPDEYYVETIKRLFDFTDYVIDTQNKKILDIIKSCKTSCGIHVRRGDLANNEIAKKSGYLNGVCETEYFINAIKIIKSNYQEIQFFFFSDDINYVKESIIPKIKDSKCFVIDINTAEDGYKDLFLLSNCDHQIASVGSLGITSYALNPYNDKLLITNKESAFNLAQKAYLLDNKGEILKSKI